MEAFTGEMDTNWGRWGEKRQVRVDLRGFEAGPTKNPPVTTEGPKACDY